MNKIRLNINARMLLYLLGGAVIVYVLSLGITVYQSVMSTKDDTFLIVEKTAAQNANRIKAVIDSDFKVIQTLAYIGNTFDVRNFSSWIDIFMNQQKAILEKNTHYLSVATSFELRFIDSTYFEKHGRYLKGYYREDENIKMYDVYKNIDGDIPTSNYYNIKTNMLNWISDPQLYSYSGKKEDAVLNTNISVPIVIDGQYAGLAGADIKMDFFQSITDSIKPFSNSYAFILSNQGVVVAHPKPDWIGKKIADVDTAFVNSGAVMDGIHSAKVFSFYFPNEQTEELYHFTFVPIHLAGPDVDWYLAIAIPENVITSKAIGFFKRGLYVAIIGIILMALIISFIARSISRPIVRTTKILKDLSLGKIDNTKFFAIKNRDELGEMADSVNTLIQGLSRTAVFAEEIGKGKFDVDYQTLSDNDLLGNALFEMRKNLVLAKEEDEARQRAEKLRRWAADGYSLLNDILRKSDNLHDLSYTILTTIIKYVDATMGCIYVLNDTHDDDIYFEMVTSVAYEREKLLRDKVKFQEGLAGRSAHEKLTIHMREIPEDYVKVTSGLGEANPRSLVLVPLVINDNVMGVLELVSFNHFEDYHIEFLEKAGQTIASDISTSKINQQTELLLKQSQEQAEALAQQEEEMRQNMEEIQATQESLKENQARSEMIFDNVVDAIVAIDARGLIELWNPAAEKIFGYTAQEAVGQNIRLIMLGDVGAEHDDYLKRYLRTGQRHVLGKSREVIGVTKSGKKTPIELRLEEGRLGNEVKFIGVLRNIEDKKRAESLLNDRLKELERVSKEAEFNKTEMELLVNGMKEVSLYAEYDMNRRIIDINKNFLKLLDKKYDQMIGVQQGAFEADEAKKKEFDKLWDDLTKGKTRKIVQHVLANNKSLYFSEIYIPVKNIDGKVFKILNLSVDITDSIKKSNN